MRGRTPVASLVAAALLLGVGPAAATSREDGSTALHWAAYEGDAATARQLLKSGVEVNAKSRYGVTAIQIAAESGDFQMLRLLIDAGADTESPNAEGQTLLMSVARTGNVDAARLLLKRGAKANARENFGGQTALMWAVARGHAPMAKLLLEHGARADDRSTVRDFPRRVTAEGRAKDLPTGGFTPLLYAAREGCVDCARVLVEAGADLDLADPDGVTPLMLAMSNLNWDVARYLVLAGADVNQWDIFGQSPLFVAVDNRLLPATARGVAAPPEQMSETDSLEMVRLLLERGANPDMQLLFRPAHRVGSGMVRVISRGTTPLIRAALGVDMEALQVLIEHGADVNLPNADGTTAMMAVFIPSRLRTLDKTEQQVIDVLRVLHAAGASVDALALPHPQQRLRGGTVMHLATRQGWTRAMEEIAGFGADMNIKDADGLSALDYALARGYVDFLEKRPPPREDLANMLRGWGATVEDPTPRDWPPVSAPLYFKAVIPPL